MRALRLLAAIGAIALALPASAQVSIGLHVGYIGSSSIDNVTTGGDAEVRNSAGWAATVAVPLDAGRELQLLYHQQSTNLKPGGGFAPFDVTIHMLHIGGTVFVDGPVGRGLYFVGGVGVTYFSPATSGYGSEVKPSLNLGIGYEIPLGERFALRAEARGYVTFVNSSGGFLCSGGCIVVLKSDAFTQGEASLALIGRF